jgi:TatD DNase family protein
VVKNAPLEMIMSETDCPYVTPIPYRGKRNEPIYVQEVVKKIAEIREEDLEKVKKQLVDNAFRVFGLK